MYVLSGSVNVFYFPAPFKDPANVLVSLTSYIPFLLPLLILPFSVINYLLLGGGGWSVMTRGLLALITLTYIILIALFVHWGFYDVFN